MSSVIPAEVVEAAVTVCGKAFHFKQPLRVLMIAQGVPASMWDRYAVEGASKFVIARHVFADLAGRGENGRTALKRVIGELANMSKPHESVEDKVTGRRALAELKHLAMARNLLIDPEALSRRERRRKQDERTQELGRREVRLSEVAQRIGELWTSSESPQSRGYALERHLVELFDLNEMKYRPSFRQDHEQIDGAFEHLGFQYLVEARWRSGRPTVGDLADFKFKVDAKLDATRGLFLSMTGFDEEILAHFMGNTRGTRNNLILFDGQDLVMVLEGRMELREALDYKISKASQEGQWWAPLAEKFG